MKPVKSPSLAVWALTDRGIDLARRIAAGLGASRRFAPLAAAGDGTEGFVRLQPAVAEHFRRFSGHVFVMATGIVVRMIGPLLRHKVDDPAVVVVDEAGRWAISLISGHIGGANRLAGKVAAICGAEAVITTASDGRGVPALDVLAVENGLAIENPAAIKAVSMALINGEPIGWHDPGNWLAGTVAAASRRSMSVDRGLGPSPQPSAGVFIDELRLDLPAEILVLRPPSLVVGLGCNRDTGTQEILDLVRRVFEDYHLSPLSLTALATIDLKRDEPGLMAAAEVLKVPIHYFSAAQLALAAAERPASAIVHRHVGVGNVCEAAAILAAAPGPLMIPKHKTANVTVAIARRVSTSSASDPAAPNICRHGPEQS